MSVIVEVSIDTSELKRAIDQADAKIRQTNRQASEALGRRGLQLFKGVISNWANKPQFEMVTNESGDNIEVLIGTDDKVFSYLDQGTSVRYALMSRDFRAKSTPGSLQSGPGRGGVVLISRKHPRPGIKARHFADKVAQTLEKEAEQIFNREIKRIKL